MTDLEATEQQAVQLLAHSFAQQPTFSRPVKPVSKQQQPAPPPTNSNSPDHQPTLPQGLALGIAVAAADTTTTATTTTPRYKTNEAHTPTSSAAARDKTLPSLTTPSRSSRSFRGAFSATVQHPVLALGWTPKCSVVCNGLRGEFLGGHDRDMFIQCTSPEYVNLPLVDIAQGGCIMTCSQFERAAGRELSKKWKESIHVVGEGEGSKATLISWIKRTAESDYGMGVVGKLVWVCWCADAEYYQGTIMSYNPDNGKHTIQYSPKMVEELHLPVELISFDPVKPVLPILPTSNSAVASARKGIDRSITAPEVMLREAAASHGGQQQEMFAHQLSLAKTITALAQQTGVIWHQGSGNSATSTFPDDSGLIPASPRTITSSVPTTVPRATRTRQRKPRTSVPGIVNSFERDANGNLGPSSGEFSFNNNSGAEPSPKRTCSAPARVLLTAAAAAAAAAEQAETDNNVKNNGMGFGVPNSGMYFSSPQVIVSGISPMNVNLGGMYTTHALPPVIPETSPLPQEVLDPAPPPTLSSPLTVPTDSANANNTNTIKQAGPGISLQLQHPSQHQQQILVSQINSTGSPIAALTPTGVVNSDRVFATSSTMVLPSPPGGGVWACAGLEQALHWMHEITLSLDTELQALKPAVPPYSTNPNSSDTSMGGINSVSPLVSVSGRFQTLLAMGRREENWAAGLFEAMSTRYMHFEKTGVSQLVLRQKMAEYIVAALHESSMQHDMRAGGGVSSGNAHTPRYASASPNAMVVDAPVSVN